MNNLLFLSVVALTFNYHEVEAHKLGETCQYHKDCRTSSHPSANCHPITHTCMCGPGQKVGQDGDSCVDRDSTPDNIIIEQQEDTFMARPKPIPKDALNLQQVMIAAAVRNAVDKEKKLKYIIAMGGKSHNEEIMEAIGEIVKKTRHAKKQNTQIITMAVKESLMRYKIADETIEKAVKQAIEEESVRRRRFTDISDRMSILLMISGCLMIAVPITVVYVKKMKERAQTQGLINRIQQYKSNNQPEDDKNFVAENYMETMKDENILNPKFLSQ